VPTSPDEESKFVGTSAPLIAFLQTAHPKTARCVPLIAVGNNRRNGFHGFSQYGQFRSITFAAGIGLFIVVTGSIFTPEELPLHLASLPETG
jgi:hypothetical protein